MSQPEAAARQALEKAELAAGAVTTEESRKPAGSVLRQSPAAGTRVAIGTPIALTTAVPVTVLVPALAGATERDARARLAAVELAPGTIRYRESPHPGTVLSQTVAQGTRVPIGTAVSFVLGVVETVPVPSVVGLTVEQARDALAGGRLTVGAEESRPTHLQPEGTVLAQSVAAGTRMAVGRAVGLTVAAIEMVAVPRVVGLSRDAADAAITGAGLTLGAVTPRLSIQAGGTVLAQALQPIQQVPYGTPVPIDEARPRVVWMAPAAGVLVLVALVGLVGSPEARAGLEGARGRARGAPTGGGRRGPGARGRGRPGGVRAGETPAVRLEVRITPVVDRGSQDVSGTAGDLVRGERRERAPERRPGGDTVTTQIETAADLLSGLPGGDWVEALTSAESPLFARLTRALPARGFLNVSGPFKTIAGRIPDLLRVDLGAILVGGWKKVRELERYADPAKCPPDETIFVKLGQHTVTSSHKPSLDIVVDGVKVDTVPFELKLTITLDTALLTIRGGEVLAVAPGACKAAGEFKCEGFSLVKRESRTVKLPGKWTFKQPIKIRD